MEQISLFRYHFFLTKERRGRPRKHINFAGKPVPKTFLYGNGLT